MHMKIEELRYIPFNICQLKKPATLQATLAHSQ